jgi:hypothetical protein
VIAVVPTAIAAIPTTFQVPAWAKHSPYGNDKSAGGRTRMLRPYL